MVAKCPYCPSSFTQKFNLHKHIKKFHDNKVYICHCCCKKFLIRNDIKKHLQKKQAFLIKNVVGPLERKSQCRILCKCGLKFLTFKRLIMHIEDDHEVKCEAEELSFSSVADFEKWREKMEQDTKCHYIKKDGSFMRKNKIFSYLNCFRSGVYTPALLGRKRRVKSQGSCKIGFTCPSRLIIRNCTTGKCEVTYLKTHFGHGTDNKDLAHLRLSKNEKEMLAEKLAEGVPFEKILDDVRNCVSADISKVDIIAKQDLHNICRDFKIKKKEKENNSVSKGYTDESMENDDDSVGLKLMVDRLNKSDQPPFVIYKPQGVLQAGLDLEASDFMLVIMTPFMQQALIDFGRDKLCIDTAYVLSGNNFQLTSIFVIDELGVSLPGAFCITNTLTEDVLNIFFTSVQKKLNASISCNTLMTLDSPSYINTWINVMGKPKNTLLCSAHVERSWRKNLYKVTGGREKQSEVYQLCRSLLEETNREEFLKLLPIVVNHFENDDNTVEFGKYFQFFYSGRPEMWAFTFRKGCGLKTNMRLEGFHTFLKKLYLKGKRNKRIDCLVTNLIKFSRDRAFDRIVNLIKGGKATSMIKDAAARHMAGSLLPKEKINYIDENIWEVQENDSTYTVSKALNEPCCPTICKCNICLHSYYCNCSDSFINNFVCKHIHAVYLNSNESNESNEENTLDKKVENIISNIVPTDPENPNLVEIVLEDIDNLKTALANGFDMKIGNIMKIKQYLGLCLNVLNNTEQELELKEEFSQNDLIEVENINFDHHYSYSNDMLE